MMTLDLTDALHLLSTIWAASFCLIFLRRLWKLRVTDNRQKGPILGRPMRLPLTFLVTTTVLVFSAGIHKLRGQHEAKYSQSSLLASCLAMLGLGFLLVKEQLSRRDSDLATLYILISILCDVGYLTMPNEIAGHLDIYTSRTVLLRCCSHLAFLYLANDPRYNATDVGAGFSPEEHRSLLNRVLFLWINPILLQGYRHPLTHEDMPALSHEMSPCSIREAILESWSNRAKPETSRSLPLALLKCLERPFLAAIAPRLCLIVARYSQPILITASIKYATLSSAEATPAYGYLLVVSAVVIYVGLALSTAVYQRHIAQLKIMTRSALICLIYEKTMELPSSAHENGETITLLSTDTDSLDGIAEMIHEIWAQIVEVFVGVWLLASQVGWIWPLPLVLIYLSSHVSKFVAKNLQPRQKAWNNATQTRIAATSAALESLKIIKMIGLQSHIGHHIQKLRQAEMWTAEKLRWVMVYYNASANALGIFSPAITLVIFAIFSVSRGDRLDTTTAFTTMAILSMVTHPANMVMTFVPRVVAAMTGIERIQAFLLRPSLHANMLRLPHSSVQEESLQFPSPDHTTSAGFSIQMKNVRIGSTPIILQDINIDIPTGQLVIVSGATGSGKSTLLRAILGEIIPSQGTVHLSTRNIAYCAQRPWLPSGTVQDAVFGATTKFEELMPDNLQRWYDEVVEICCLTHDVNSLANGHKTMIGSRGLNLSGGQRQRVALARALFAHKSVYLLDDTFSSLDGETEKTIFNNLFRPSGLLRRMGATVILASNSTQYFSAADHIVILGDQGIIDQGNWKDLQIKSESIAKFSSSHALTQEKGTLSASFDKLGAQLRAKGDTGRDLARQTGDTALYGYYLGFLDLNNLVYLVGSIAIYSIFITVPQYWLRLWTSSGADSTAFYVGGFLLISLTSWLFTSVQGWSVLIRFSPQSGLRLHQRLLHIAMRAPLSFLSTIDNGSILNRFTQDMQLVDKQLPGAVQSTITQTFKLFMQIFVLCAAERWLALSLPVSILVIYGVQKIYLRTSRQLRYLELDSRARVFSGFLESVEGLETIRAFSWSRHVSLKTTSSIDYSQRPEFLLLCVQRWLSLVLDLLAAFIATCVIAIAVKFRGHVNGAQVGIALNIMLATNATLLKLVENFTNLEISLGAIARFKELEQTTPIEGDGKLSMVPAKTWPSQGHIEFIDITASYSTQSIAIRDLSLDISPGQKLIICGRTGSGKSSVVLTLLRLLELRSGKIKLDGIDITQVDLNMIRERCFIVMSQDPLVLMEETLRFNLDPSSSASDETLKLALQKAGLWTQFAKSGKCTAEDASGSGQHPVFDKKVSLLPELSVGQCQLLAICRTLIKSASLQAMGLKPVVILDEVTSSLDVATESTIYQVVEKEFSEKGHTVIIIAHRLGALHKYMKVGQDATAFMKDGRLQELKRDGGAAMLQDFQ
ncbi:putative ABC transporter [Xylariaceae sp. FL0255]|nr:putative ABC transporter [Xylariaceae sp. FL0255]